MDKCVNHIYILKNKENSIYKNLIKKKFRILILKI